MQASSPDTDELLARAAQGDDRAVGALMARHRQRLRRMIAVRLDARVVHRVDPSDVVQESLVEASQKLPHYLEAPPLPFYPWLRQIACNRIARLHEQHIRASKRTVNREEPLDCGLNEDSVAALARQLIGPASSPSRAVMRAEQRNQLRVALERLASPDRDVLVMWYLEGLAVDEVAAILGITEAAAKVRHFRAIRRLSILLKQTSEEG